MISIKPVAVVSPMKKAKKSKKKVNKISPQNDIKCDTFTKRRDSVNYDIFNKSAPTDNKEFDVSSESSVSEKSVEDDYLSQEKTSNHLCSMFENLNLEQDRIFDCNFQQYDSPRIPEHDRKILERMATKMKRELSNIELAHRAHVLWQNEKEAREKLQREQELEYNKYIKSKRSAEKLMTERKIQELKEMYDWEKKHLKHRLISKERMAAKRIAEIELRRSRDIQWKHKVAEEKARNALDVIREHKLAEIIWRKQLAQNLEKRILHADNNRELLLKYCRQRAVIDNRVHQELQKQNWRDVKDMEAERWLSLKRRVESKAKRILRIQQEKDKFVMRSRKLADSTARMRENLKRSLSPDTFLRAAVQSRTQHYRSTPEMCFTPNNFESHIKLG